MTTETSFIEISTHGKGLYDLTPKLKRLLASSAGGDGTATVFVCHTSASLVIFENADPSATTDLLSYFERMVPEDGQGYVHTLEGPDDMTSHIRMALTRTVEVIPIKSGQFCLGTWQGVYLFEHRRSRHNRRIAVNLTLSALA